MLDYKQTPDGDLDFTGEDLVVTESTAQHQRDLLLSAKGHIRQSPEIGVDSIEYLQDNEPENYLRAVRIEFSNDGMDVKSVGVSKAGSLKIDAEYENN